LRTGCGGRRQAAAAFWFGCLLVLAGVCAQMPMTTEMWIGMAMIPVGLMFAMYGVMPRPDPLPRRARGASEHPRFHVADSVPLNRAPLDRPWRWRDSRSPGIPLPPGRITG
jgi:hypothetical protein